MSDIGILRINGQSYGLPQEMLDDITTAIANNAKMIAEDYDSTKTYNTGDKVTNGNKLYKAKVDNITGTWDATKWDEDDISSEIDSIEGDISTLTTSVSSASHTATWGQINGTLANQTDVKSAIDAVDTRVDNLLNIPQGSTTADAALYDIKTGFDGVVYGSPGAAVRGCDQKLYNISGIDDIYQKNKLKKKVK